MQKFIVTAEGRLRYGDVALHKHLLMEGEVCIGGGMYEWDYLSHRLLLSGRSFDFGRVKWDWVDTLILPSSLAGFDLYYEDLPLSHFTKVRYE